ncbi:unnamed protein product [Arctogadus glacialis]
MNEVFFINDVNLSSTERLRHLSRYFPADGILKSRAVPVGLIKQRFLTMSDGKPFLCTAPGCGQRFTNEDHLAVHKHKHEMTLKFGPARNDSVIVADQTPTPTRFLKNCEEVGLFNELASPYEHDFKKASDYDIKKMPLDLSPLATPIIMRSKMEDHTGMEVHRVSPLLHPESTTNDDQSSSVPSALSAEPLPDRAHGHPSSRHKLHPTHPHYRPGIPGPHSPQLVQSEAKLALTRTSTLPLPVHSRPFTRTSTYPAPVASPGPAPLRSQPPSPARPVPSPPPPPVQAPAPVPAPAPAPSPAPLLPPPEDSCPPQPLQQPATSTTETPASPGAPAQRTPPTGGRRRRATSEDPDEKRRKFLERNRAAATRCREKRKVWVQSLERKAEDMNSMNGRLQSEVTLLRSEVAQLKQLLLAHKDCPVTAQQKKSGYHISEKEESCEDMSVPGSPQSEAIQHSSVSTSDGLRSAPSAPDRRTEEGRPPGGAARSQPSGS